MRKAVFVLMLLISVSGWACDLQGGWRAYKQLDHAKAFSKWKPCAEEGNAFAQYQVGWMYRRGEGAPQDDKQAVYWWTKAAEQGHPRAQYTLGVSYREGEVVAQDYKQAAYWYTKAAENGDPEARFDLGYMYRRGQGVPRDYVQAYMWFSLAAAQGYELARYSRDNVAEEMAPEQIEEAKRLALEREPASMKRKESFQDWVMRRREELRREEAKRGPKVTKDPPETAKAPTPQLDQAPFAPGAELKDCVECPVMVVVPAGRYVMGAPQSETFPHFGQSPQHEVTIDQTFAVGKYEVTLGQFRQFVEETKRDTRSLPDGWDFAPSDEHPVMRVNWQDAKDYAQWMAKKTGKPYRLLTEAEWEYAARAGTTTTYPWGDEPDAELANFFDWRTSNYSQKRSAPVGSFPANAFGLYDMIGNVWEWVEDCYAASYDRAPTDGSAWVEGETCDAHVLRGGSFRDEPKDVRSASRYPGGSYRYQGFRLARTLP